MTTSSQVWRRLKMWTKARLLEMRGRFVRAFLSYDSPALLEALRALGVKPGDDVMLHSAFGSHHGFRGSVDQLVDTFLKAVAPDGHLLMVSLPYRSSTAAYLEKLKRFDVRKTPSMMGLVSEHFRRRPDVLRSLHPTHPMLVHGPKASWYVEGHEHCAIGCGAGTPFEKVAERDGVAVFFNVPFDTFTFFHHLEHLVSADLPFALYLQPPRAVPVVDREGRESTVAVQAYTPEAIRRRRFAILEQNLRERGLIAQRRVGNTRLLAVRVRAAIACTQEMRRSGRYFYDLSPDTDTATAGHPV